MPGGRWQFWIDRGGTFTDIVAHDPNGRRRVLKILSENPRQYADAAIAGIHEIMNGMDANARPFLAPVEIKMGTTIATNALLERKGARILLAITAGFEDQLEIGTQARPDIFARRIVKPEMLYARVAAVRERVLADGTVEQPLDALHLRAAFSDARKDGIDSVAIVFLHGYTYPQHEIAAVALAEEAGFTHIAASHAVAPLIRVVPRGDTTVADAYLTPVLARYVSGFTSALESATLGIGSQPYFMTSAGGLRTAPYFRGCDAVLSGPAGGVVAMAETARLAGYEKVIGVDMGGTSTDVSHYAGEHERTNETVLAGVRLTVPMLNIHTVAAGGGSILTFDGNRMRVGPESAGAAPGPACYRRGGPLTVTDANVMTGKLKAEYFPRLFGPDGDQPIDTDSVSRSFGALAEAMGGMKSAEEIADGFIRIAAETMAAAIKKISVERGYDVSAYLLNSFGSAGGQHACLIADILEMRSILIHPLSGVLSAYGMGLATVRASREQTIERPLGGSALADVERIAITFASELRAELRSQGVSDDDIALTTRVQLRAEGSDTTLAVAPSEPQAMIRSFDALHVQRFGFSSSAKSLVIASLEVVAEVRSGRAPEAATDAVPVPKSAHQDAVANFFSGGTWHAAKVFRRENLLCGQLIEGPALVIEPHQTIVVESGWQVVVTERDDLLLTRRAPRLRQRLPTTPDPAVLEIFNNLFMSIAEQMGEALRATAQSVNIKERLDFSCAVFDHAGGLVSNAPHLPVHLGSMDRAVESVIKARAANLKPGDVYMLNAPYNGGTHLPDITVVTPVYDASGRRILFFVASRGHHEDIGGLTPGSMTPRATRIEEEGILIDNVKLVEDGRFLEAETLDLLSRGPYPARQPAKNVADLQAQVAANARGAAEIEKLIALYGLDVVEAYMQHVQNNAEESVRRLISNLRDGHFRVETDQGTAVEVTITIDRASRSAKIDFTGTSSEQPNNFNAPEPVTRAAVLYVFRVMVDSPIPINAGCLKPLDIIIPEGTMLSPRYPAAVVAGNTETSQIVTNALFGALGVLGSSQGTMNNLTFGNAHVQYYETICSGAPAGVDKSGAGFDGADAVHVHMTNTRLTDPEILELRYPVVVEEFAIRRGSGGKGRWRSGDGIRRTIRFREPMKLSILSGFRRVRPFGLEGGSEGEAGRNTVRRSDGRIEDIGGTAETELAAGEAITIETPTGGGLGLT